jgi:pyridoxine 5-phosphate synthase
MTLQLRKDLTYPSGAHRNRNAPFAVTFQTSPLSKINMTRFSCNVNRVALLRNSRTNGLPNLVECARIVLAAGADGITIHPRPDQRHIKEGDVAPLHALVAQYPQAEFNIEGNPHHNLMALVQQFEPHQSTFVPDSTEQATSDHGFAPGAPMQALVPLIARLKALGVRVSVFVDADIAAVEAAKQAGADRVELYTEPYAESFSRGEYKKVLAQFAAAASAARACGLGVNAGHDLNQQNLPYFLEAVRPDEVSIGHAVIADAVVDGLERTVRAYLAICKG